MDMMYYGHYGMGFGWVFQLLILFVFIGVVFWIVSGTYQDKRDAKNILDERLAKGEITLKEYKELKKEIGYD